MNQDGTKQRSEKGPPAQPYQAFEGVLRQPQDAGVVALVADRSYGLVISLLGVLRASRRMDTPPGIQ